MAGDNFEIRNSKSEYLNPEGNISNGVNPKQIQNSRKQKFKTKTV
jgi:hypothetical protein